MPLRPSRTIGVHSHSWSTTRPGGRRARTLLVALPRCSVPRDNQHGPLRAPEHSLSDRTLSEALPPPPPIGSKDHEIGFPRIRMQHNHASRIAVLLDRSNRDARALRTLPQAGQKFEPFALVPRKRMGGGCRVKDVEPGFAHTSNAERSIEGRMTRLRQIDRAQDLLHDAPFLTHAQRVHRLRQASGTSSRRSRFAWSLAAPSPFRSGRL